MTVIEAQAAPAPISVSVRDAAERTSLPELDIRNAINEGALVAHKSGNRLTILTDDLGAWVKGLPATGGAADSRQEIQRIYAELDEGRQEELAEFASRLLEEGRGGRGAPRAVTLGDARRAAERLGVSTADVAGALGFDD